MLGKIYVKKFLWVNVSFFYKVFLYVGFCVSVYWYGHKDRCWRRPKAFRLCVCGLDCVHVGQTVCMWVRLCVCGSDCMWEGW